MDLGDCKRGDSLTGRGAWRKVSGTFRELGLWKRMALTPGYFPKLGGLLMSVASFETGGSGKPGKNFTLAVNFYHNVSDVRAAGCLVSGF